MPPRVERRRRYRGGESVRTAGAKASEPALGGWLLGTSAALSANTPSPTCAAAAGPGALGSQVKTKKKEVLPAGHKIERAPWLRHKF